VSKGADEVGFPSSRKSEGEDIVSTLEEVSFHEGWEELLYLGWEKGLVERGECLFSWEVARFLEALDASDASVFGLELDEVVEELNEAPSLALRFGSDVIERMGDGWELECAQEKKQRVRTLCGPAHVPTS
jgi:hypothetical protein